MKIRTLMIASFLFVAGFTPALTIITQQAVQQTSQDAKESIDQSLNIIDTSKKTFESSEEMLNNLEKINNELKAGEISRAVSTSEKLSNNYQQFLRSSKKLGENINESSTRGLEEELQVLRTAREDMKVRVRYIFSAVRTGSTISNTAIDNMQEDFQRIASASATINSEVIETQSEGLVSLHERLGELSKRIVAMGGLVVFISIVIALAASIRLSRPIKELSTEAEKIKNENLDDVNLSRINTRTKELTEFKEVLSDMVLALKAEFDRERSEMNELALKVVSELEEEVPRGTAESSVTSAMNSMDIEPIELEEEDLEGLADKLEVSLRGLDVDEEVFDEIRGLKSEE